MYIIQRRSDGLYWRNTGGRPWGRTDNWVSDLQEVKPFRTVGSILASFAPVDNAWRAYTTDRKTYERKKNLPECCKAVKWNFGRGWKNKCAHFKYIEKQNREDFYKKYAIYPVAIVIAAPEIVP